jgi:hypothetical protein
MLLLTILITIALLILIAVIPFVIGLIYKRFDDLVSNSAFDIWLNGFLILLLLASAVCIIMLIAFAAYYIASLILH